MADKRKAWGYITLHLPDEKPLRLELFDMFDPENGWTDKCDTPGLFRVRAGRSGWIRRGGRDFDPHTPEAVGALIARLIREDQGESSSICTASPDLAPGSRVRFHHAGKITSAITKWEPFQRDGQYFVKVAGIKGHIPLDTVEVLEEA